MARLFETFVRNFYKIEQSEFTVKGEEIKWKCTPEGEIDRQMLHIKWKLTSESEEDLRMLPIMQTDISLCSSMRKIIIDTKFYKEAFKAKYAQEKINSNHLYQLFSYLKNQESDL